MTDGMEACELESDYEVADKVAELESEALKRPEGSSLSLVLLQARGKEGRGGECSTSK